MILNSNNYRQKRWRFCYSIGKNEIYLQLSPNLFQLFYRLYAFYISAIESLWEVMDGSTKKLCLYIRPDLGGEAFWHYEITEALHVSISIIFTSVDGIN